MADARLHANPPREIVDLARRLGVPDQTPVARARLRQSGTLRQKPSDGWMRFTARQSIEVGRPGFVWTARTGPFGMVSVTDRLAADDGGGEVRLLGLLPLARSRGEPAILKGELLRYLAELPWAPDALLANPALTWRVDDAHRLTVSASAGGVRAEASFTTNESGLIADVQALRPRQEGRTLVERPWCGHFADYREMGGRLVPSRAEVSWEIDGPPFVCWRGQVEAYAVEP